MSETGPEAKEREAEVRKKHDPLANDEAIVMTLGEPSSLHYRLGTALSTKPTNQTNLKSKAPIVIKEPAGTALNTTWTTGEQEP